MGGRSVRRWTTRRGGGGGGGGAANLPEVLVEDVLGVLRYLDAHEAVRPFPLEVLALDRVAEGAGAEVLDDEVASRDDLVLLHVEVAICLEARRDGVVDHLRARPQCAVSIGAAPRRCARVRVSSRTCIGNSNIGANWRRCSSRSPWKTGLGFMSSSPGTQDELTGSASYSLPIRTGLDEGRAWPWASVGAVSGAAFTASTNCIHRSSLLLLMVVVGLWIVCGAHDAGALTRAHHACRSAGNKMRARSMPASVVSMRA